MQAAELDVKEVKKEAKGGMILYPVEYFLDDSNEDLSYCYGVNEYSKPVIFYLNPTEESKQNARKSNNAQTVPCFEEFADDDRRAPKQCLANSINCPKTPDGILLMEQISIRTDGDMPHAAKYPDIPVYNAKWASILREGEGSFKPPIGFGYMEIGLHPKINGEVEHLQLQYNEVSTELQAGIISEVDAEEKKETLFLKIMSLRQKWFTSVILKHKMIHTLASPTQQDFANSLLTFLPRFTENGMYGGALIRVRKGNVVDTNLSCYCNMGYDYKLSCVQDVNTVFSDWMKFNGGKIIREASQDPSIEIDIIPTQRINFGKMSVEKYDKELCRLGSKIMKTYIDSKAHSDPFVNFFKDKVFLASKIGVRLAKVKRGASKGGVLASTIHSFSSPLGNAFAIDNNGQFTYQVN